MQRERDKIAGDDRTGAVLQAHPGVDRRRSTARPRGWGHYFGLGYPRKAFRAHVTMADLCGRVLFKGSGSAAGLEVVGDMSLLGIQKEGAFKS